MYDLVLQSYTILYDSRCAATSDELPAAAYTGKSHGGILRFAQNDSFFAEAAILRDKRHAKKTSWESAGGIFLCSLHHLWKCVSLRYFLASSTRAC